MKRKMSRLTVARMIASGALLGIVIAGMFGVDVSMNNQVASLTSGALGAAGSALLLKIVHLI